MTWNKEMSTAYTAGLEDGKAGQDNGSPNDFTACYDQGRRHGRKSVTEKVGKLLSIFDCNVCFASLSRGTIIDVIHPATGRTFIFGKTLAECREEYPDVEEMTVDAFSTWKAEQQHTPITWGPTTKERYDEMLGVLPPARMIGLGFLVGEPWDHDAATGEPRYEGYRQRRLAYEVSSRPMTRAEFYKEMTR